MATHKLALILKNPLNEDDFLLVKQSRPPKIDHEEYDSYVDSDLWDLPSAQLNPLQGESESQAVVEVPDSHLEEINLKEFDVRSALNEVVLLNMQSTPPSPKKKKCFDDKVKKCFDDKVCVLLVCI